MNKNEEVDQYINDYFGYFDYFDTRAYVVSAMNNTLDQEYPNTPFTAGEVIAWAKWNDENSYFMTAGKQAIEGETVSQEIFGTPDINPQTNKANSQDAKNGYIGNLSNDLQNGALTAVLYIGASFLLYEYLKKRV